MSAQRGPYALQQDEGEAIWFLGTLMTVKAGGAETGDAFTLLDQVLPPGFAPPPHRHQVEDEAFYLLEGAMTVTCDGRAWELAPGGFIFLPRGLVHGFQVSGRTPTRVLQLTLPAGFERFARTVGEPARETVLPPPAPPDVGRLLDAAARHHIEITPPA
ncbi:MAG TPA: quercetin 2,3-dioxygenase [Dehalococcoidia bacterium]